MTMEQEHVAAAKERAEEVVNGFRCATERNARDALKLAEYAEALQRELRAKERQVDAMKKRMLADSLMNAANKARPPNPMEEFFRGIGL